MFRDHFVMIMTATFFAVVLCCCARAPLNTVHSTKLDDTVLQAYEKQFCILAIEKCSSTGDMSRDAATANVDKTSMPFVRRDLGDFIGTMTPEDKLIWEGPSEKVPPNIASRWKQHLDQMVIGSLSGLPPRPGD
jgi:hypothetical protein